MAAFDLEQQRVCVRVVYDGVASAGKTTNLRRLAELFATQRTCEVFSPEEMDGRTVYFDWLQIAAGMVCGFPLVCQVITVPGQVVLTPRRRHLLLTADVVVYVCDSDKDAVPRAVEGLAPLDRVQKERSEPPPMVVQANKQDQPGAIHGAALLAALGRDVPVVEAIASDGVGVVDTFVAAVRGAVRAIQARMEAGHFRVPVRAAETATDALAKVAEVGVDPEWAAEMLLEQAAGAFGAAQLDELLRDGASDAEPPAPDTWRPERARDEAPPLPTEDVPTGYVWPAHTGRASLRVLASHPGAREAAALDGEGILRRGLGEHVLSTTRERRFENAESARQALVRAARAHTQLGPLLDPETVLVVQPTREGACWLWTIEPRMPTVAQRLAAGDRAGPAAKVVLVAFAHALADALKIESAHGWGLELGPAAFGVRLGAVRYVGSVPLVDAGRRDLGRALARALADVAALVADPEPLVAALEGALAAALSAEDSSRLAASTNWTALDDLPPPLRGARRSIEAALARVRSAA